MSNWLQKNNCNNWEEIQNYIKAVNFSIERLQTLPLSTRLLRETHKVLMQGVRGEQKLPGEFRKSQNWLGPSLKNALFVPPHHEHFADLMTDLKNFWGILEKIRINFRPKVLFRLSVIFLLLAQGCAPVMTRNPLPENLVESAKINGIPRARVWGDEVPPHYQMWKSISKAELASSMPGVINTEHTYLAISGGGPKGAYGAGILVGWTESNTRPEFTVVTGVSVGALTAPFAFLGPDYDDELKTLYTEYYTSDLIKIRNPFTAIWRESLASSDPLKKIIAHYVDNEMVSEIAAEYKKGRGLYIITTNLDVSRPVIWNLGAIAASNNPNALNLIRDVICASASIPALMPPVYIEVEAKGEYYDEMHVDGGASSQVMFYPVGVDLRLINKKLGTKGRPKIYVIRNGYFTSPYNPVKSELLPIMTQSLTSLIQAQGGGDLFRIYFSTLRDGLDYRLTFIPSDFDIEPKEVGGLEYMKQLFELGRGLGRNGTAWHKAPPGVKETQ